jgi:hypothetical protein
MIKIRRKEIIDSKVDVKIIWIKKRNKKWGRSLL